MVFGKKMNMTKHLLLIISCICTLACSHLEVPQPQQSDTPAFEAHVETITKTETNQSYKVLWSKNDQIAVYDKSTLADIYQVAENTEGSQSCTFHYVKPSTGGFVSGMETNHIVALYPYSKSLYINKGETEGSYKINMTLPEQQVYTPNSVGLGTLPMTAITDNGRVLRFKHLCGVIRIQLKGSALISSLTLKGNANETLAGAATATINSSESTPVITMQDNGSSSVQVICEPAVQLKSDVATDFHIVIPPSEFKAGFTITIQTADNAIREFKTNKPNPVNRAEVLNMPEITFEKGLDPNSILKVNDAAINYMWDESVIPEITIKITEDEWNKLLFRFDEYDHNVDYFHADFIYKKGQEIHNISDGGLRLRGNTSRRRPEGYYGQAHDRLQPDWHHCHFGINFRKFHKDSDHTINGIRKINLKWFKDDPNYVRELYCYDLFRRYGIWTAAHDVYCRLWLQVGEERQAYLGVYEMIEPIDDEYLKRRVDNMFESHKGNLWKCGGNADMQGLSGSWSIDLDNGVNYDYEYKGDEEDYASAKEQFEQFILNLCNLDDASFYDWIKSVCDVEFLLKTYAVNVAVGMCDDFWNNGNNYYVYFNSTDKDNYKFFFIPYDYDNTLGTSWYVGITHDPGRQDPYNWGDRGLLMERLMKYEDFRKIYKDALQELASEEEDLFHPNASIPRIQAWQGKIRDYVSNDTGEDMSIYDDAADWGDLQDYLLLTRGSKNYFDVKVATINAMN